MPPPRARSLSPFLELSEAEKTAAVATQLDLTCEAVAATVCVLFARALMGAGTMVYPLPRLGQF